jgi:hypothetical protein
MIQKIVEFGEVGGITTRWNVTFTWEGFGAI